MQRTNVVMCTAPVAVPGCDARVLLLKVDKGREVVDLTPVHREKAHVLPLDSIRGIAAISVVIHHVILMKTFLAAFFFF